MHLDRALGNIELARDQLVAQAAGDMLENCSSCSVRPASVVFSGRDSPRRALASRW